MSTTRTEADEYEALVRERMACLPADRWPTRQERADELKFIDCLIDAWLEVR